MLKDCAFLLGILSAILCCAGKFDYVLWLGLGLLGLG